MVCFRLWPVYQLKLTIICWEAPGGTYIGAGLLGSAQHSMNLNQIVANKLSRISFMFWADYRVLGKEHTIDGGVPFTCLLGEGREYKEQDESFVFRLLRQGWPVMQQPKTSRGMYSS